MKLESGYFDTDVMISYAHRPSSVLRTDLWETKNITTFYAKDQHTGDKYKVTVPKGYLSDGATVPRMFWDFAPTMGRYTQSVILHDWLCEYLTVYDITNKPIRITRADADEFLRVAMISHTVSRFHKFLLYSGVRIYAILTGVKGPHLSEGKRALERLEF